MKIYLLLILNSVLDLLGLATILPLFAIVLQDDFLAKYPPFQSLYDTLGLSSDEQFVVLLAAAIFLVIVTKNVVGLLINREQGRFAFSAYRYLTERLLDVKLCKGLLYLNSVNSNDAVNQVVNVPRFFANSFLYPLILFFNELTVLLLIVVALLLYDPLVICLLAVVVFPFFLLFYTLTKNKIQEVGTRLNDLHPLLYKPVFELIFGFVDVSVTQTQDSFKSNYMDSVREVSEKSIWQSVLSVTPARVVEVAVLLGVILIMLYGLFFIESKEGVIELLSVFGLAAYRTIPTINRMMNSLIQVKSQQFALDVLEQTVDTVEPEFTANVELGFHDSLKFESVSYRYPGTETDTIKELSFTLRKGSSIGVIGRSGGGKTTLVNILLMLLSPTEGQILVDDVPLTNENSKSWLRKIGYVRQDVFIVDGSVVDNIAFGLNPQEVDQKRLRRVIQAAALDEFVSSLPEGVNAAIGERGASVSGGQRQRIGIARALYHGAELLVFDEATSALDTMTENEINATIRDLAQDELSMIIVAHRHSTLQHCDKIIELSGGRIVNQYTYADLVEKVSEKS